MYVSVAAKQQAGASPRHGRGDNKKRGRSLSGIKVIILKDKDQRNFLLIKARGGSGQWQTESQRWRRRCARIDVKGATWLHYRAFGVPPSHWWP